ncbi:tRNA (guanosine(46)-N7)-methyltransferase TrmB [Salicibibacter cibarius]|uniref:tRNA (guanine-N(7)-)-methyltransferase n=1 Tax=Salicibibacter cibarius TaxID=2743000 RepID=A0A7T6Z5I3_9BACI|nr:tRNA (guanosine(46)-N7)-methyltransferase TrmB [Salicibibacter cibarius]QQK77368.1 tRNA (guanosine(46)-N7)-methyltransferase TrmB [Salicibibacter cibarius]
MRLRRRPGALEVLRERPGIVPQKPEQLRGQWTVDEPLHVELGTGKGRFLALMAEKYPTISFIGMEKMESVLSFAVERMEQQNNVCFIHGNVADIHDYFADGEVDRIYLNFTDPWPKNRHEKRRLTYPAFLNTYKEVLSSRGDIHLKTDNEDFFTYSLEQFSRSGYHFNNLTLDLHAHEPEENVRTEYEEKFAKRQQRIFRVEAYLPG